MFYVDDCWQAAVTTIAHRSHHPNLCPQRASVAPADASKRSFANFQSLNQLERSDLYEDEADPDSFSAHTDLEAKPNFRKTYSDHFPLTFTVEIVDDDD